jgi:hypothetical protein
MTLAKDVMDDGFKRLTLDLIDGWGRRPLYKDTKILQRGPGSPAKVVDNYLNFPIFFIDADGLRVVFRRFNVD